MKSVESALKLMVVALVAGAALALAVTGRTAVNRTADYRELTAPKSLHQLAMESRLDDGDERSGVMLLGAGLFALLLVGGGGLLFAATSGNQFGRAAGRRRKRARRQPPAAGQLAPMPAMRVLPPATRLPALPAAVAEEGHYEDPR